MSVRLASSSSTSPPPADSVAPPAVMPVSYAQQQLWLADRLDPGSPTYTIAEAIELRGALDASTLHASLEQMVERHEILRTTFDMREGQIVQLIHARMKPAMKVIDLSLPPADDADLKLSELESAHAAAPFDLKQGPLTRFALVRFSADRHVLLAAFHHIVFDGWSSGVFWRDLSALYNAARQQEHTALPELPIQYADYAQWQQEQLQGDTKRRLFDYWRQKLTPAAESMELPCDHPRPPHPTHRGDLESLALPEAVSKQLAALAGENGATTFMAALAAFKTLLYRYDGRNDIVVGTPVANRSRPELADLIGFFVNTLVLRTRIDGLHSFRQVLQAVKQTVAGALSHEEMPFEQLVEQLAPSRGPGRNPLFQVAFMHRVESSDPVNLYGLTASRRALATHTAKFDLMLVTIQTPRGLECRIEYSTDLFEAGTIRRMLSHFAALLTAACAEPNKPIASLPVMDEDELDLVVNAFNHGETTYPRDETIHERFAQVTGRSPNAIALICEGRSLTYRQLDEPANRLARYLRSRGVGPDVMVSICLDRNVDVIIAILAVLKAGGAYVPLDPAYPAERIAFILQDTRAPILITSSSHLDSLPATDVELFCLDRDRQRLDDQPATPLPNRAQPDHLAYVMYTSGSTGTPKGVMIPHRAVMRLVHGQHYTTFDAQQVWLHTAPISFDASTLEVWGPLLHGGKCVLVPHRNPTLSQIQDAISGHGVTSMFLTTALFNLIIDQCPQMLERVKHVMTGGEAMSLEHIRRAFTKLPDTKISNVYGPTESTTFATAHVIDRANPAPTGSVPIGRPIAHTTLRVLDANMQPVPIGVRGQLWIGGDGLARGYLNQPQLSDERFVCDPLASAPDARLYRSGDEVRWLPEGTIEFLGRGDDQVKIHGFRIEPGEIEARLNQHADVASSTVVAQALRGDKRLVAYVVPRTGEAIETQKLDAWLRMKLPAFMVPAVFVMLDALPLTPNGKVDRKRLPEPAFAEPRSAPKAEPRDDTERKLVDLWQRMLERDAVGIHDDFFALGGHSLLAARLFEEIRQDLGADLPLSILFDKPTIAQLAPLVSGEQPAHRFSSLVPLQPNGDRPPLFLVHGIGGDILMFKPLIEHFPADQPLYGLQARGLNHETEPDRDIPSMAAHYVELLRAAYPSGPYLVGGFSSGGAVALEIAQQLTSAGQRVQLVAVIDTSPPSVKPSMSRLSPRFIRRFLGNLPRWLANDLLKDDFPRVCRRVAARLGSMFGGLFKRKGNGNPTRLNAKRVFGTNNLPDRRLNFIQTLYSAWRTYQAQPYPGRIALLRARILPLFCRLSEQFGWEQIADDVDVLILPGSHSTVTAADHAPALASALLTCIEKSRQA